jgi:hypothetical protein
VVLIEEALFMGVSKRNSNHIGALQFIPGFVSGVGECGG